MFSRFSIQKTDVERIRWRQDLKAKEILKLTFLKYCLKNVFRTTEILKKPWTRVDLTRRKAPTLRIVHKPKREPTNSGATPFRSARRRGGSLLIDTHTQRTVLIPPESDERVRFAARRGPKWPSWFVAGAANDGGPLRRGIVMDPNPARPFSQKPYLDPLRLLANRVHRVSSLSIVFLFSRRAWVQRVTQTAITVHNHYARRDNRLLIDSTVILFRRISNQ